MDLIEKRRLVSAAEAVYGHLQLARSEAIRQGVNMHLNYQTDGATTWCLGINNDADCDCTVTTVSASNYCGIPIGGSGNEVLQVGDIYSTVKYFCADFVISLTFSGGFYFPLNLTLNFVRGSVAGLGGAEQFLLFKSARGLEMRIAMNFLGRVRICSPAGASNVVGYATC